MATKKKIKCNEIVYMDNNATTMVCESAKKEYMKWISCYNASSDSVVSKGAKKICEEASDYLLNHCNVSSATHTAIFNSGASEGNCFAIRACVKAYRRKLREKGSQLLPHVVLSAIEHSASMDCVDDLVKNNEVMVSYVQPTIYGTILPGEVEKEIRPNTCLVSVMFANNEIPVINNIKEIAEICHKNKVPLHSDCVQLFGKYKINIERDKIDILTASPHKFYGVKGVGILIINNDLVDGYGLTAEINGSQNNHLRGGTINVPAIAATLAALKSVFTKRQSKNEKLFKHRSDILEKLASKFKFSPVEFYLNKSSPIETEDDKKTDKKVLEIVSLGPPESNRNHILPNTLLIAVCKNKGKPFCNVELKKFLDSKGIVVSIGSACNTASDKASHVVRALGANPVMKRGVIRVTLGDETTSSDVNAFLNGFYQGVKKQCSDIDAGLE